MNDGGEGGNTHEAVRRAGTTWYAGQAGAVLWIGPVIGVIVLYVGSWLLRDHIRQLVEGPGVQYADGRVLQVFRAAATPTSDRMVAITSWLGSPLAMAVLAVLGAVALARRRHVALLVTWLLAFAGVLALADRLKLLFQRARPSGAEAFLHRISLSFPSTHSFESVVGFGMVAFVTIILVPASTRRTLLVTGCALFIPVIGMTRLALGVHYLSDVVAGFIVGACWLAVCIISFTRAGGRRATLTQSRQS